jgi:hypothetical protein
MLSSRLVVAGLSLALIASPAAAQRFGTFEFGALGRYTKFDKAYQFDNGTGFGGRVGMFLAPNFELEGEGSYLDIDRGGAELRFGPAGADHQANYTPLSARGTVYVPVTASGVALSFGAGIVRSNYRFTYNWGPTGSVGFKIPIMSNFAARVDGVADYLPTPKRTNLGIRAGLSYFLNGPTNERIVERVINNDDELLRLRNDRSRLDSITAAYNRLRDSLSTAPGCVCQTPAPAPAPIKVEKEQPAVVKPEPIKTKKDKP